MSNRKRKLPSVQRIPRDESEADTLSVAVEEEPDADPEVPTPVKKIKLATLEIPLGEIAQGAYVPRFERTEFRSMSKVQSEMLIRITRGLEDDGATLANGTRVTRRGHAIRWILENLEQPD